MGIDVNKVVGMAQDAATELSKNEDAKKAVDGVIETVETKVGIDLPTADDALNMIKKCAYYLVIMGFSREAGLNPLSFAGRADK